MAGLRYEHEDSDARVLQATRDESRRDQDRSIASGPTGTATRHSLAGSCAGIERSANRSRRRETGRREKAIIQTRSESAVRASVLLGPVHSDRQLEVDAD